MAENSTVITLPQMIDLSLNCPELGSHNFSVLHTMLHVLLRIAGQHDVAIEFKGEDSDKIQNLIKVTKPSPMAAFKSYNILMPETGSKEKIEKKVKKKISLQAIREQSKQDVGDEKEIQVIERRHDSKQDPIPDPSAFKSPRVSGQGRRTSQSVIVVDSSSQLPQFSVAITKENFEMLQKEVESVQKQVKELSELPGNVGLIEATRSTSGPIVDMFQIMNLVKRMDAVEGSMQKFATLIEDLARSGSPDLMDKVKEAQTTLSDRKGSSSSSELDSRLGTLENTVNDLTDLVNTMQDKKKLKKIQTVIVKKIIVDKPKKASVAPAPEQPPVASLDLEPVQEPLMEKIIEGSINTEGKEIYQSVIAGVSLTDVPPAMAMGLIQQELENVKKWIQDNGGNLLDLPDQVGNIKKQLEGLGDTSVSPEIKLNVIERKFSDCIQQMNNLDLNYNNQINTLQDQLVNLQKEVTDIIEKIDTVLPGGDSKAVDAEVTSELYTKLMSLEQEMAIIQTSANQLQEEKEMRDKNLETIAEQIDLLKIVKANREDLEEALGDKADACMINRKVSHDQFDQACDDLSRGIEEALSKLTEQEEMWQQALNTIQQEIGNKLDKVEVAPLRDFVNAKLKALQEKFKSLTALKREQEAAGTKSKFLRNVTCISCDKDVIMRKEMDPSLRPQPYSLPPNKNIAPYLAYELDQLRKQQKCVPGSKNLNFYENALKSKGSKDKNHICNRYCGGSHTTTTPQQRVTRLGHFLEQWGPEIAPVNDEYVKGKDNQMYKARDDALLNKMRQETQALKSKRVSTAREDQEHKTGEETERKQSLQKTPDSERKSSMAKTSDTERKLSKTEKPPEGQKRASVGSAPRQSVDASAAGDNTVTKDMESARKASTGSAKRVSTSGSQPRTSTQRTSKQISASKITTRDSAVVVDPQAQALLNNAAAEAEQAQGEPAAPATDAHVAEAAPDGGEAPATEGAPPADEQPAQEAPAEAEAAPADEPEN